MYVPLPPLRPPPLHILIERYRFTESSISRCGPAERQDDFVRNFEDRRAICTQPHAQDASGAASLSWTPGGEEEGEWESERVSVLWFMGSGMRVVSE